MNDSKLIVTEYKGLTTGFLFEDGDISEIIVSYQKAVNVGDIYVGRISNVKNDLNACFVDISDDVKGFLPFEEIYPEGFVRRNYNGKPVQGDIVLVQVSKEAMKTKDCSLTMHLSLAGVYSVVTFDDKEIHFSSKLKAKDTERLEEISNLYKGDFGFIVRTNAGSSPVEVILSEVNENSAKLKNIVQSAASRTAFTCLYKAEDSYVERIKSISCKRYDEIITDSSDIYNSLSKYFDVRFYDDKAFPLKALYSFDKAYSLATDRKVMLKGGGYLIIDKTEALSVIDVNSGKFDKKVSKEEAAERVNREAAFEIARQLRLRNLSGIIIVDFINTDEKGRLLIKDILKESFKKDSVKTTFVDFTPLGLCEITRQKKFDFL